MSLLLDEHAPLRSAGRRPLSEVEGVPSTKQLIEAWDLAHPGYRVHLRVADFEGQRWCYHATLLRSVPYTCWSTDAGGKRSKIRVEDWVCVCSDSCGYPSPYEALVAIARFIA